jgi:hypothetical protein
MGTGGNPSSGSQVSNAGTAGYIIIMENSGT